MPRKKQPLDVLGRMISPSWRGVEFPCGEWEFGFEQDHAEHKFPDKDGALVEATGRSPATYTFTAFFRNGLDAKAIVPTASLPLYPTQWRKFIAACLDRTTGSLVHPELGPINVKLKSCKTKASLDKRDGVDVDVTFVESPLAEDELTDLLKQPSPMGAALANAGSLDDAVGNIDPVPEYPDSISPSLLDSMKQLSGALQQFRLGIGNIGSLVDSYLDGIADMRAALVKNGNPAKTLKAIQALDACFTAVAQVAADAKPKGRPVTVAIVQGPATPDAIAAFFGTPVDDFLRMNPLAADRSVVPKDSQVLVYVAGA